MSTHLETGGAEPIQRLQAAELLQNVGASTLPTILVGDFNSDAGGSTTQTYGELVNGGLVDTWHVVNPNRPGLTGSQKEDLRNSPSTLNRRIDLIFTARTGDLKAMDAYVVGDKERDRTPSGMWPSDHAGVITTLRLPAVNPF
jgi:endonuclease/exonuclease/phosphatase family metal-dependent hydrolase